MASERAGKHVNARDALGKAAAWAAKDGPDGNWVWTEQLETQQLLKEARSVVGVE